MNADIHTAVVQCNDVPLASGNGRPEGGLKNRPVRSVCVLGLTLEVLFVHLNGKRKSTFDGESFPTLSNVIPHTEWSLSFAGTLPTAISHQRRYS